MQQLRMIWRLAAVVLVIGGWCVQGEADSIEYKITDVGTFTKFLSLDTSKTYASGGAGFVGLYDDAFAHLLGVGPYYSPRTAIEVDISALAGKKIQSAVLSFDLLNGIEYLMNPLTITSYTATGDIGHYYEAPDDLGSILDWAYTGSNAIDVTDLVAGRVDAGADWLGLHLMAEWADQWTDTYAGRGGDPDSARLRLLVTYAAAAVPEPATFALTVPAVIVGLGMFVDKRRRAARRSA